MKALAAVETEGTNLESIPKPELLKLVTSRMWEGAECSISTLFKARKARDEYKTRKARRR